MTCMTKNAPTIPAEEREQLVLLLRRRPGAQLPFDHGCAQALKRMLRNFDLECVDFSPDPAALASRHQQPHAPKDVETMVRMTTDDGARPEGCFEPQRVDEQRHNPARPGVRRY